MNTLDNWTEKMIQYTKKCGGHLFTTPSNKFYKLMPIKIEDKWFAASITFGMNHASFKEGDVHIKFTELKARSSNSLNYLKYESFPSWDKRTSIKNFKAMREKMVEVEVIIVKHWGDNNKIKSELKTLFGDMKVKKADSVG